MTNYVRGTRPLTIIFLDLISATDKLCLRKLCVLSWEYNNISVVCTLPCITAHAWLCMDVHTVSWFWRLILNPSPESFLWIQMQHCMNAREIKMLLQNNCCSMFPGRMKRKRRRRKRRRKRRRNKTRRKSISTTVSSYLRLVGDLRYFTMTVCSWFLLCSVPSMSLKFQLNQTGSLFNLPFTNRYWTFIGLSWSSAEVSSQSQNGGCV